MGTVANLAVRIGVNAQDFEAGIAKVGTSVSGLGSKFATIGAGLAKAIDWSAIGGAAERSIETASRIADMAERVGISAEAVQRLQFAATQSGGSFEAVATSMRVMADRLTDGKLPQALTDMGLSLSQLKTMTPDQAFTTIADAVARIPDPMLQSATAVDIFGRGAQTLLPAIKAGFTEVGAAAPLMSNAVVAAADQSGDKFAAMQLQLETMKANALLPLVDLFTQLPTSVQMTGGAFLAMLPTLSQFGILFAAFPGTLAGVVAFFTTTLPAAFAGIIAFLGPQGLIALAVLALAGIWYAFGDQITAIVQGIYTAVKTWLVDKWTDITKFVSEFVKGFTNVFLTGKNAVVTYMQQLYEGVKTWLMDKITAVFDSVKAKIEAVKGYFKSMASAIVLQSYVPDMVKGIAHWFGQLDGVMVGKAQSATGGVTNAFSSMSSAIGGIVDGLQNKLSGWLNSFMPSWAADVLGGLTAPIFDFLRGGGGLGDLLGGRGGGGGRPGGGDRGGGGMPGLDLIGPGIDLIQDLWRGGVFRGGEEALHVNPVRDAFLSQFGGAGTGAGSGFAELARRLSEITGQEGGGQAFTLLNQADTVEKFNAAVSAITSILERGGGFSPQAAGGGGGTAPIGGVVNNTFHVTVELTARYVTTEEEWIRTQVTAGCLDAINQNVGGAFSKFEALVDQALPPPPPGMPVVVPAV